MKKLFSVLLAGAMLTTGLSLFAGCGSSGSYEIDWDVDLSNPIEINALYPSTGLSNFGSDDTAQIIEETTGYKVNYTELSESNGDNDVQNFLLTKEKYQIMKLDAAQFSPYLSDGIFLDLTELLTKTESGQKLYQLIDLMPYGWDSVKYTNADGTTGIYAVPDFGYCVMEDSALVWNTQHLIEIGYVNSDGSAKIPETLGEFTDALEKLQEKYGATNSNYHAFGLGGSNSVRVNPILSAFDCPLEFYVDDDGNVQQYVFSEAYEKYVQYMYDLKAEGILSDSWQNSSANDICSKFATELNSCVYVSYWWVTPLVNAVVTQGKLAAAAGVSNDYQTAHDQLIGWATRLRGDGTNNSVVQEAARIQGGDDGVSYYTVIPYYMAEDAVYIIDFLAKKLENFAAYYGGTEGVHWNKVDAPEGAPAEYDENDMFCMSAWEDYTNKIIYMRPWSYELNGETISGGGYWIQLTDRYIEQIVDNSQYCNGTNSVVAISLFHLRETGFDAWQVTVPMDETIIKNPMTMAPPFEHWSIVNILSRTKAVRGLASAIDTTSGDPVAALEITRQSMLETYAKSNGVKYFYWSDDIVSEMTQWYNAVKLART